MILSALSPSAEAAIGSLAQRAQKAQAAVVTGSDADALLEPVVALTRAEMEQVNADILRQLESRIDFIPLVARHLIESGGKRLRPMLTLASAGLCGYEGQAHIPLASCVEFIHSATLLHDDVVDQSGRRRHLPTANAVWGNKASVLVGDFLLSRAFRMMVEQGSLEVLRILSEASAVIAEGEVLQLVSEKQGLPSEEIYLDIIRSKTAALFGAACELGAAVADKPELQPLLRDYGMNLGIAFQIVDDALDYHADPQRFGKQPGDDFREGKATLPVILAWQEADGEERDFWTRTLAAHDQQPGDLERAVALITDHRGFERAMERAAHYCDKAVASLSSLPDLPARAALLSLSEFCLRRAY